MEKAKRLSKKFLLSYRKLPEKKPYIEAVTAVLSVPVLITVIMLNLNNLNAAKTEIPTPTPQPKKEVVYVPVESKTPAKTQVQEATTTPPAKSTPTITTSTDPCKPEIGPVSISSPAEGETVTDNPASVIINYKTGDFCAAVWSYRVNNGNWSNYDDKSLALYNLPDGNIKIDLRVKSIVSGEEKTLTRNFIYNGDSQEPDQEIKTSSSSAN
jgi:hypothetical protein